MTNTKNEIIGDEMIAEWINKNLTLSTKNTLYFDSKQNGDVIIQHIFKTPEIFKNLSVVIVNGILPGEFVDLFGHADSPNLLVINKKIETPLAVSLNIGKKSYLYRDTNNEVRAATDDYEIARVLDQIHGSFESLAW